MRRCSTAELRHLEIINLCDGARLGYASDFEFDKDDAKILAIVIPGSGGFFGIGKEDDLVIPWELIERIGEDTILVRLTKQDLSCCVCPPPKRKKK